MAFVEATVIIGGALDERAVFDEAQKGQLDPWLAEVKEESQGSAEIWEVFVLEHDHPINIECECVQYDPVAKPYWTNDEKAQV